jgi:crotonobetainyl-CoA:carnitine CoA-transferase CaiB-like acyl-CoA transferase
LLLAVGTDAQFAKLLDVLDDAGLRGHDEWLRNTARVASIAELRSALNHVFERHSTQQWLDVLATSGVPHAPILDVASAFSQPQIRDGDFLGVMQTPGGETTAMRTPLLIDGERPIIRSGPRRLGEDTAGVLDS